MNTLRVRRPAVAGSFYPAEPQRLRAAVEDALRSAGDPTDRLARTPVAIVAPHAGYAYSGPTAALAYARLLPFRGQIELAVLLGPAHRVPLTGVAAASAEAFETPLGVLAVDLARRDELMAAGLIVIDDRSHRREHSLEVHLPFLQVAVGDVKVLPLLVGDVPAAAVVAVIEAVWCRPQTLLVVSTDLSHYHDHGTAQRVDRRTADAIVNKRPEALGTEDACGAFPLRGLLLAADQRGLEVELLDLRTSGDAAGDRHAVVGYGAFVLYEPPDGKRS